MNTPDAIVRSSIDPYAAQHAGLVEIHHALIGSLHAVVAASSNLEIAVQQALAAGRFLLAHHQAESTILFPILRRHGTLLSSDVAFLDGCDRDHVALHALCDRLLARASGPHPEAKEIAVLAGETAARLSAHVREEEAGLAPARLRTMIGLDGLAQVDREMDDLRRRYAAGG